MNEYPREITRLIQGRPMTDGAGVKLTRVIGGGELDRLDPFLLLDRSASDKPENYIAGFPSHPHRGFETVTYLLHRRVRHKDSAGNERVIESRGAVDDRRPGRDPFGDASRKTVCWPGFSFGSTCRPPTKWIRRRIRSSTGSVFPWNAATGVRRSA